MSGVIPRLLMLAGCALAGAAQAQNNVLVLLADDVGVDAVGAYAEGVAPPATPNIDALAASGVLFRNAWSYPECSPTRACIQTGRYGLRTGIGTVPHTMSAPPLSLAEITLPQVLSSRAPGYAHAAIGKWHLANASNGGVQHPNLAGWSHFAGEALSASWNYYHWNRTVDGVTALTTVYCTTQNVDDALAWIQSVPEPWVCYVAFLAGHVPFHVPPSGLHRQSLEGLDPNVTPIPFYKAAVEAMDTEVGRLLNTLGPAMLSRTNVIFTADNGTPTQVSEPPFLPSHAKQSPYEGGINVPMIVAGPAVGSPGREDAALVSSVDLFATIAELCGAGPYTLLIKNDSVSFVPHLASPEAKATRTMVYAERFSATTSGFATVRDAQHKLIRDFDTAIDELYDLAADPFEQTNLLNGTLTSEQQTAFTALAAEITAIRDTSSAVVRIGATGCVGSMGTPTIVLSGTPRVGQTYTVSLSGAAPGQLAVLLTGLSSTAWGALSLPLPLENLGSGPACMLWTSGEAAWFTTTDAAGAAAFSLPLPNFSPMVAATVHHTWLAQDPAAPNNPIGLISSDALAVTIGK